MNKNIIQKLISLQKNSYSIYSKFAVSCIIEDENNNLFLGVNYENACYPAGICAERNAFGSWVANKGKKIINIYIKGGENQFTYPCGICRQVMNEFTDTNTNIYIIKNKVDFKVYKINELLPFSFGRENLNNE